MTITCDHFVRGYVNGQGYKFLQSAGVNKLSEESLTLLLQQGGDLQSETWTCNFLPTEQLVAVSYLKPLYDEYGRRAIWNHTILIAIRDYLELTQAIKLCDPHLMRPNKNVKGPLAPLVLG